MVTATRTSTTRVTRPEGQKTAAAGSGQKKGISIIVEAPMKEPAHNGKKEQYEFVRSMMDVRTALSEKGRRMWNELKSETVPLGKGETLFGPGMPSNKVFFVESGSVALVRALGHERTVVNIVKANMLLGYRAYYAGLYRPVTYRETAEAFERDTILSEFSSENWQKIVQHEPALLQRLLMVMSWEVGDMMKMLSWRKLPLKDRVPTALIWAANGSGDEVMMRQSDICRVFDVTVEAFCRTVRKLEKKGLIRNNSGRVTVTPELRRLYGKLLFMG